MNYFYKDFKSVLDFEEEVKQVFNPVLGEPSKRFGGSTIIGLYEDKVFNKGDFVTLYKWLSHQDNSYKGDVLEVLLVEGDYIILRKHSKYDFEKNNNNIVINLNDVELVHISDEFIRLSGVEIKQEEDEEGHF